MFFMITNEVECLAYQIAVTQITDLTQYQALLILLSIPGIERLKQSEAGPPAQLPVLPALWL
jgi:hypothetical protein